MRETLFKFRVQRDLRKEKGIFFRKIQQRSLRGFPDIVGCWWGRFFAIELKVDGGRVEPLQVEMIRQILLARGVGMIVEASQWEEAFLELRRECEKFKNLLER